MVPQFSAVRFLPFLAHMRPCSVIFLVLEGHIVSHFCPNMPLGVVKDGEKKKIYCNIKNEHVTVTFVNHILNFKFCLK